MGMAAKLSREAVVAKLSRGAMQRDSDVLEVACSHFAICQGSDELQKRNKVCQFHRRFNKFEGDLCMYRVARGG